MISQQGISKKPPDNPSLDFKKLREEGIRVIQALSGKVWTDYNLHDPGITTLEILCYALTELGYRTELLKEALQAEGSADPDFIDRYFFRYDELIPHLPLTKWDFEHFIEKKHPKVISAWFEPYPLFQTNSTIQGGYEIALLLEPDERFGNLNTDVIHIPLARSEGTLEVIFFDPDNNRLSWKDIRKVTSCKWDKEDTDHFFVFENYNCQVALLLEVVYQNQRKTTIIKIKARVTLNPPKKSQTALKNIAPQQKTIIRKLESPEFHKALTMALSKEQHKAQIFAEIQQFLLPYRNLCEDFISLRTVNEQEIKIDAEIILDTYAPSADAIINRVLDSLDAFLFKLLLQSKKNEHSVPKNILYASNLIEEMVEIEGVEAASILNLNLFVDGVPTIPLKEETSFECIHLQRFSYYVPKISREKSSITFIRSGTKEKVGATLAAKEFSPHFYLSTAEGPAEALGTESTDYYVLSKRFFEDLRQYYSIQNDFPQNYRLREGGLSSKAPETLKVRVRQFKAYLVFYERILIDYLDKLCSFPGLLSINQRPGSSENELEWLKNQIPDLDTLKLIDTSKWKSSSKHDQHQQLMKQHELIDHLLARFATSYMPIITEPSDIPTLEKTLQAKMRLLKDIPVITRERGLGLPIKPQEKVIWGGDLLSGFQKRLYRLLGVNNNDLKHLQLTKFRGKEPVGFYLVEHLLLIERKEKNIFSKKFNGAAKLLFEYMNNLSVHGPKSDPYSFQLTVVLPNWYSDWMKRRNTLENIIKEETPAHILLSFYWLNKRQMGEFEILYKDWLKALLQLYKV